MRSGSLGLPSDHCIVTSATIQCTGNELFVCDWSHKSSCRPDTMRKFFDSRRELVSSGPGSGGGGGSSGSSHAGGNFIGRAFTVGRHQVTVEEIIAEGENLVAQARWCHLSPPSFRFHACCLRHSIFMRVLHAQAQCTSHVTDKGCNPMPSPQEWWSFVSWIHKCKLEAYCFYSD